MKIDNDKYRMWGGRFKEEIDKEILNYTIETDIKGLLGADYHLLKYEIISNYAHILMLNKQGIIEGEAAKKMLLILKKLEHEEDLSLKGYEDIHSFIEDKIVKETRLTPHICRSRNDQVILLERLYMREKLLDIIEATLSLIDTILRKSLEYGNIIIPAYTHWRQADVTTITHLLRSYAQTLIRDVKSLQDLYDLINQNPLGSSAISGCTLPIDRAYTSKLLGFTNIQRNTIDVVTNRWEYQARYLFTVLMLMKHLSTISRDIIFLSLDEIKILDLEDKLSTGSSALPHKKNPDILELIIGKTKALEGFLVTILSLGGDSSGYHREGQEGKWIMIKATGDVVKSIHVMNKVIATLKVNMESVEKIIYKNSVIPEVANQIAFKYKISFRTVHKAIGKSLREGKYDEGLEFDIDKLTSLLRENELDVSRDEIHKLISQLDPEAILKMKKSIGGPGDKDDYERLVKEFSVLKKMYKTIREKLDNNIIMLREIVADFVDS